MTREDTARHEKTQQGTRRHGHEGTEYILLVISCQLSVTFCQLSINFCQMSVTFCQLSVTF